MHCTDIAVKLQMGGANTFTCACARTKSEWVDPVHGERAHGRYEPPTLALQARHAVVSFSLAQRHMQQ